MCRKRGANRPGMFFDEAAVKPPLVPSVVVDNAVVSVKPNVTFFALRIGAVESSPMPGVDVSFTEVRVKMNCIFGT